MNNFSKRVFLPDDGINRVTESLFHKIMSNLKVVLSIALFLIALPAVLWAHHFVSTAYDNYAEESERQAQYEQNRETKQPIIAGILAPAHIAIKKLETSREPLIKENAKLLRDAHSFLKTAGYSDLSGQFANLKTEARRLEGKALQLYASLDSFDRFGVFVRYLKRVDEEMKLIYGGVKAASSKARVSERWRSEYPDISFDNWSKITERDQERALRDVISMIERQENEVNAMMRFYKRYAKADWDISVLYADRQLANEAAGEPIRSKLEIPAPKGGETTASVKTVEEKNVDRAAAIKDKYGAGKRADAEKKAEQDRIAQLKAAQAKREKEAAERAARLIAEQAERAAKLKAEQEAREAEAKRQAAIEAERRRKAEAERKAREAEERKRREAEARRRAKEKEKEAEAIVDGFF